jgi:hypothetical protein
MAPHHKTSTSSSEDLNYDSRQAIFSGGDATKEMSVTEECGESMGNMWIRGHTEHHKV